MSGVYAERTRVSVDQSRSEIERTLTRYGADAFAYATESGRAMIRFRTEGRFVEFLIDLPDDPQAVKQRWRALLLCVKSKLEAVRSGIMSFEDEFLAHIVLPDGSTFGRWARPELERVYATGEMPRTLLALPAPAESGPA